MGWGFTLLRVINTASGFLLKNLGEEKLIENAPDEVTTSIGALTFIRNVAKGESYVKNNEDVDYYLYFSRVNQDGSLSCAMDIIPAQKQKEYTAKMTQYIDGHITYSPVDSSKDKTQSVLTFTAEYIQNDKTNFINETQASLTYELTMSKDKKEMIFTSSQKFIAFEISFSDRNNLKFNLKDVAIDNIRDYWEARVLLPQGCSQLYPFKEVRIDITIPEDHKEYLRERLLTQDF
jgi:hypothetical protein